MLSQLMALFGFFALVLVSVYWVNRAVLLFDKLISDGQTALVVLEFTALSLPYVIKVVLPVAAFAATVYAVNRLTSESELVVMQATGFSPWRLARPVLVFGVIVAALLTVLVHVLVPASRAQLADRQAQIAENVTARFLTEGAFMHPAPGVTIYIREISARGELLDIFMSDSRNGVSQTTYTAEKALIVKAETGPKLIMLEGQAQTLRHADGRLSQTRFSDFTYDIGALISPASRTRRNWNELSTVALLGASPEALALTGGTAANAWLEVNERLAQPLMAPMAALLGFATLMLGGFNRFGIWRQILVAILALIAVQFISNAVADVTRRAPDLWGLAYFPAALGVVASVAMLWWAGQPRRIRAGRAGDRDDGRDDGRAKDPDAEALA